MPNYQLIIFDCDGVLVDSEPILAQVLIEMLGEHGVHWTREYVFSHIVGQSLEQTLHMAEAGINRALPDDFADTFRSRSRSLLAEHVQAVPGIDTLLNRLTVPYCVASSGRPEKMRTTLGATGLLPRFENRMFSAVQVTHPKPAPDIFLFAAENMGVAPEHCLVIEDSPAGVQAAVAAGMTVYGHAAHIPADKLRTCGAARIFPNMHTLLEHLKQLKIAK